MSEDPARTAPLRGSARIAMNHERMRVAQLLRDIADWLERTPADRAAEPLMHLADAITVLGRWWVRWGEKSD